MLDDGDGRLVEFGDQLEGGIGVRDVIVAEFFSLNLFRRPATPGRCRPMA